MKYRVIRNKWGDYVLQSGYEAWPFGTRWSDVKNFYSHGEDALMYATYLEAHDSNEVEVLWP